MALASAELNRRESGVHGGVLGARCGESRSPVLSPGSKEPRRETGPAAMGHPSWDMQ